MDIPSPQRRREPNQLAGEPRARRDIIYTGEVGSQEVSKVAGREAKGLLNHSSPFEAYPIISFSALHQH
jgi:hypothetical protein